MFLLPAAAFLLVMHSQIKTFHVFAESAPEWLPVHSLYVLPCAECLLIFRNLQTILWEPSNPQDCCHVSSLGLLIVWSTSRLLTGPVGLRVCVCCVAYMLCCIYVVCAYVGLVSLK